VKSQQCRWPDDDCCLQDPAWSEKQRPEAEQNSIEGREIGCAPPGPIDDQQLLLHEEAVGDNRSRSTGTQERGDRGQQMYQEDEQVPHGELG